ncbi:hypothetical protein [Brevibacterium sp.]|uniref:hypothetical protein n=1 Tax=Brevibacterium sp. TaxID=1701 RepID=UPI0028116351|nr:hypothetical protein [Brevibacterium sp.]
MPDEDVDPTGPAEAEEPEKRESSSVSGDAGAEPEKARIDDEADDESGQKKVRIDDEAAQKKAHLEKILRDYRATLRNESYSGHSGFSADDYRSQKPPHW